MRALALLVLLAACGDDGGSSSVDAAPIDPHADGGIDANLDPLSVACDALPANLVLGATGVSGKVGALACLDNSSCRITTNTTATGTAPCPAGAIAATWYVAAPSHALRMPAGWKIISATRGTFDEDEITDLPLNMQVFATLRRIADGTQVETQFMFTSDTALTLSQFE